MVRFMILIFASFILMFGLTIFPPSSQARNPFRSTFFGLYAGTDTTQLWGLPSDSKHCGVCHFDFASLRANDVCGRDTQVFDTAAVRISHGSTNLHR